MRNSISKRSRVALGAVALGVAVLLAGCGSDTEGTTGTVDATGQAALDEAKTALAQYQQNVTSVGAPTSSPAVPAGKFVVTIPCSYAAEGCKRSVDAFGEAATAVGWKTQMIDPAGDPEKMRQAVETAVRLGADGIIAAALPPAVVKDAVAQAKAAGIPVVNLLEPDDPTYDATVESDHTAMGRADAAYTAVATNGQGKIIALSDPEFTSNIQWRQGYLDGLKEFCPGCEVLEDFQFQIANLQTQVPAQFQAMLAAHPETNFVWTAYDPVAAAIQPVIERSQQADTIKIASNNGDPFALDMIKADDKALKATVAYPIEWQSYVALDQMNRLFAGEQLSQRAIDLPIKLITKDNLTTSPWDGDVDWKQAYLDLWKSGGAAATTQSGS